MTDATEDFERAKIEALLKDVGWGVTDGASALFEYALPDGTLSDYVLCDHVVWWMAALGATANVKTHTIGPTR